MTNCKGRARSVQLAIVRNQVSWFLHTIKGSISMTALKDVPQQSSAADYLEAHLQEIQSEYLKELRAQIPVLRHHSDGQLIDSLPSFIKAIVASLRSYRLPKEIETIAEQHAKSRTELSDYNIVYVLTEYHILRRLLVGYLERAGSLTPAERGIIDEAVDLGVFHAGQAFLEQAAKREHDQRHKEARLHANLAQSMQLLKALSDSTPDLLVVKDRESKLLFVNPAAERAIGKPAAELLGRNERDWLSNKEEAERMIANDRRVIESGESVLFEESLERPEGIGIFQGIRSPLRDDVGNIIGVVGVGRDVTHQRQNETALRVSEHRFRRLYETKMIGLAFWTADGRVIDANDAILETLGFSRGDLERGINWRDLTPPEFTERDERAIHEINEKGYTAPYEKVLLARDGRRVPVLIASGSVDDPEGSNIAVLFDISKAKEADRKLAESEARLSAILENVPQGIYVADEHGEPIYSNPMIQKIWGGGPMVHASEYKVYAGWSRKTGKRYGSDDWPLARTLKTGQVIANEIIDIVTFDGKCKVISVSANPVRGRSGESLGGISITDDITQRDQIERAIYNQKKWIEAVVDAIPTPVVLVEGATQQVILHNRAADRLAGGRYPEDPKEIFANIILEDEAGNRLPRDRWPRIRAAAGEVINGELLVWNWKGTKTPLLVFAHPLGAMFERSNAVVIVYLDVAKLKETEQELRNAVQTREEVLNIVTHDLKNPISAINITAELLDSPGQPSPQVQALSQKIRQSTSRMLELISNLLAISSLEAGSLEISARTCSTNEVLRHVLQEMRVIADAKRVRLVEDVECPTESLVCDPSRAAQIFSNLIGNALKFVSADVGEVRVMSRCLPDRVVFTVADNGPGIRKEDLPHIFDRFWHAKNSGKAGAGLGLAIAKGIANAHFSQLEVKSEFGKGAEFTFSIPRKGSALGRQLLSLKAGAA